ncbi:Protein of unknown function [Proteiniborus ethanoligenes]|uniref:Lipoprotein YerB n=1 Tax=Proteiniborus ethanoligenes TaxID=415015 RepID=A0A1H3R310_9FIRM|nr:DUF3048 domain-containing protein [Proteiniborus ethanoligenes]SDZ20010.1 Protein of unknown function [Proteiniborus ethanoligenes]
MHKKTHIKIVLILLLISMFITACSKKDNDASNIDVSIGEENSIDKETNNTNEEENEEEEKIEVISSDGVPSPLSGLYVEKERLERRPVAVMFDNDPKARWQAGLSQAEIVYEFLVEAPYTRYMGIFLINEPEIIGPVRSARPYFIATLLEYDPLYVRVGGSEEAKADVKKYKVADIDGLYSGAFWRDTKKGKKAPNNLYTSMEGIRKEQDRLKYEEIGDYKSFSFYDKDTDIEGITAKDVLIKYYSKNITKYEYDSESKVYKRYKDGKLHVDEIDESPIIAKNIIIQEANTKVIDELGRLEIKVIGEGKGKYITNGKCINITWKKKSLEDKTTYYNEDGDEIKFNPGITWIQLTKPNPDIEIN